MNKKIVIIGGVAGGMAAAARIRRLSEKATITVVERGKYISFASCGMPYYIEGKIKDRARMFVKTPEEMSNLFNIDIKTETEAIAIDRENKKLWIKDQKTGNESYIDYDKLIISTGAEPFIPETKGINNERILKLRSIEDMDRIKTVVEQEVPRKAVVIGGGFIGLEMAEALRQQGLDVSIIELDNQVMAPVDREMATLIHQNLVLNGIKLYLNNSVEHFEAAGRSLKLHLKDGNSIDADLVILSIGVRPDTAIAKKANLQTGLKGAIVVNNKMQTSDPDIFAVGDAVQVKDFVSGHEVLIPLAGPANRQARVVAENLFGQDKEYKNTLGTSICKVFNMTVATTGLNEKSLKKKEISYDRVYLHPANHAGYYPDSFPMTFKLLYSPSEGKVLGAQIVGTEGVDKRIDVIATAIRAGMTVFDLENLELAYAPPYNSVKDPVNVAGNIAVNRLNGWLNELHPEDVDSLNPDETIILNVSTQEEHHNNAIKGSICIPLDDLRTRVNELDRNKEIITYCQMGLRGYIAYRYLAENGFRVKNLSGGYKMYKAFEEMNEHKNYQLANPVKLEESFCTSPTKEMVTESVNIELDACGLQCPGPIMQLKQTIDRMNESEVVKIVASDPGFAADVTAWCNRTGNQLLYLSPQNGKIIATIKKGDLKVQSEPSNGKNVSAKMDKTIIVFSNDLDKALAAFIIANGASSMGDKVTLFFTFWGLNVLRRDFHVPVKKSLLDKMFGMMMPRGANKLSLSKMHMAGMGTSMMKYVMKSKNVMSLPELMALAKQNGVRLVACTMSMDVMGIKKEELIDGVEESGVAGYIDAANDSAVNLFI